MNINAELKADKAYSERGASMGRRDWRGDPDYSYKFYLQHLRFQDYCYDLGGAYWGLPANLYCAWCPAHESPEGEEDAVRVFVRAGSHEEAKAKVLEEYPNARFFR